MGFVQPKKHACNVCGKQTWGRECNRCKALRYAATSKKRNEGKPKKKIVRNYKKSGDLEFFQEAWNERPHISEISGEPLVEFDVRMFSHILPKGSYPLFRFNKANLILKTPEEHNQWQFAAHKLVGNVKWENIFKLKEELTREYYKKYYGKEFD